MRVRGRLGQNEGDSLEQGFMQKFGMMGTPSFIVDIVKRFMHF